MEFTLGRPLRVPIKIDGVDYHFSKFLGKQFSAKVAAYKESVMEAGLNQYDVKDRDGRARFCAMFQPAPVDVLKVEAELKTPDGCDEVIRWCGENAQPPVPKAVLDQLLTELPVPTKRELVDVLIGTAVFRDAMGKDSGEPNKPGDTASPLTSGGGQSSPPQQASEGALTPSTSTPPSTQPDTTTTPAN